MKASAYRATAVAAAAIVVSVVLAAVAIGGTTAPARATHAVAARTLHLVEKGGGLEIIDNPPKARHRYDFSAGDIVIVTRGLFAADGRRLGSLRLVCVATAPATQQCSGTETLEGGALELAGTSSPRPTTTVAVIGGTGAYTGVRGTSVSRDRRNNGDIADQTIELLP